MLFGRKQQNVSWIVVFLGNPGTKYDNTRHNAGFMTADKAEEKFKVRIDRLKFHALTAICEIAGEKCLLMKPQTFMNLSGDAASEAMHFYKVPTDHILVISDDVTLPCGKLRIRRSGSAGGHNGLKDIIAKCGGDGFPRIKIGVGKAPPDFGLIPWVLSHFEGEDLKAMTEAASRAADAIESVIANGIDASMDKYNG